MQKKRPRNWHLNVLSIFCGGVFPMCWISIAKPLQACFVKSHHYVMHSRRPIYLTKSNKTFLHTLFSTFCRWFAILFPESWMHTSSGKKWLPCVIGSKLQKSAVGSLWVLSILHREKWFSTFCSKQNVWAKHEKPSHGNRYLININGNFLTTE